MLLIVFSQSQFLLLPVCLNMGSLVEDVVLGVHDDGGSNHEVPQRLDTASPEQRPVIRSGVCEHRVQSGLDRGHGCGV